MKVCVLGLGYIGFPTACIIAHSGHDVLGVDVKRGLVEKLNAGKLHIINEQGLAELAKSAIHSGRLRISTVPEQADIFIIAVPTPFQREQGLASSLRTELERPETGYRADLAYVVSAARAIAPVVRRGNLVVVESTVPPRTMERVVSALKEAEVETEGILFAHAPERVLPGNVVHELVHNDRVLGGMTPEASKAASEFYRTFVKGRIATTDSTTAELVKLMENTFRDVNIALANEFALVCEHVGVSVWEAIRLANLHPRVSFLRPGPGVGGHCIAVDPYFVVEAAPTATRLIQAARRVNRRMPLHVIKLFDDLTKGLRVTKVTILGASYKADVGDDRESPGLEVARLLGEAGKDVTVHDPYIRRYNRPLDQALAGADAVILVTDHKVYADLDPSLVARVVSQRLLLDTRGHLSAAEWRAASFRVIQLGTRALGKVPPLRTASRPYLKSQESWDSLVSDASRDFASAEIHGKR
ncbi:MAG: nucleotide sugar dehydrogenase [Bacillota bacterium]